MTDRAKLLEQWKLCRFSVGRFLIHLGIKTLPPGRVRNEIVEALFCWSEEVRAALRARAGDSQ